MYLQPAASIAKLLAEKSCAIRICYVKPNPCVAATYSGACACGTYNFRIPRLFCTNVSRSTCISASPVILPVLHCTLTFRGCVLLQGTLTPLNPTKALAALKHKWEHHFDKQVTIRCLAFTQFGCNTHNMSHVVTQAMTESVVSMA